MKALRIVTATVIAVGVLMATAPSTAALLPNTQYLVDTSVVARWGKPVKVPALLKRDLNRARDNCGYFLERCPLGSSGERALLSAGRAIMCSQAYTPYKFAYPSLSVRTPKQSWATMLVQYKLAWSQQASGKRVTVAVDGQFGPSTERAWREQARYGPISVDGSVAGKSDWIWVFMFYCGD